MAVGNRRFNTERSTRPCKEDPRDVINGRVATTPLQQFGAVPDRDPGAERQPVGDADAAHPGGDHRVVVMRVAFWIATGSTRSTGAFGMPAFRNGSPSARRLTPTAGARARCG